MNHEEMHHVHGTRREPGTVFRPEAMLATGTALFGFGVVMADIFLSVLHGGMSPQEEARRSRMLGGE